MSTLVIMQPTYLPWAGYFNLIANTNHFVFLDDVKVEKQSWQVRNKILNNQKKIYISVPTIGSRYQRINEIKLDNESFWRKKHSKLLEHSYKKHPFGETCLEHILPIINNNGITSLSELNIQIILTLSKQLGLLPTFHNSSQLNSPGVRSERLVSLCNMLGCDNYLSPIGSKDYIEKDGDFARSSIRVQYQNFSPPHYPQKKLETFLPYLSIIDMIANIGWTKTATLIK